MGCLSQEVVTTGQFGDPKSRAGKACTPVFAASNDIASMSAV